METFCSQNLFAPFINAPELNECFCELDSQDAASGVIQSNFGLFILFRAELFGLAFGLRLYTSLCPGRTPSTCVIKLVPPVARRNRLTRTTTQK